MKSICRVRMIPLLPRSVWQWSVCCLLALCSSISSQAQEGPGEVELPSFDLHFVPAHQLDAVLRSDRPGVQLSGQELRELLRRAAQDAQTREGLPLTLSLKQVDVRATLDGSRLQADMTLHAENFVDGWASLPIPLAGWGLLAASEDFAAGQPEAAPRPAAIARHPEQPAVLLWMPHGRGSRTLRLTLTTTLSAAGNDLVVNCGLPSAPTGTFAVELPPGRFVEVDGVRLDRPGDVAAPAVVEIPIGRKSELPLRFTDRIAVHLSESLTLAVTNLSLQVRAAQITWTATTDLSVFGSGVDRLECTIPGTLEITQVEAEGLQAWELSGAGQAADLERGVRPPTNISLQFRQPIQGSRRITFRGILSEAGSEGEGLRVPTLTISGVSSHVGYVAIDVASGLRLKTLSSSDLRTIDPSEYPRAVEAGRMHLFQFWNESFELVLATLPRERKVHVAMTNIVEIGPGGLDLLSVIDVNPLFDSLFDVEVTLPVDWSLLSVQVDGMTSSWQVIPREAGVQYLRIPLPDPALPGSRRSIQLNAHRLPEDWPIEDVPLTLALPPVQLPQADVVEAVYGVIAEGSLDVQTIDLDGLDPAGQPDIDRMNARLSRFGKQLTLGFVYQNSHFSGEIRLTRRPAQLFVDLTSLIEPATDRTRVAWRAELQVEGGGVKELEVSVPEEVSSDVRFVLLPPGFSLGPRSPQTNFENLPRIVQQTLSPPAQGRRVWTLQLDRRLIGRAELSAVFQAPRLVTTAMGEAADDADIPDHDSSPAESAPDGELVAVTSRLRSIYVRGTVRSSSVVAVIGREEQHLRVRAESTAGVPLKPIDPIDVPTGSFQSRPRMVASYQSVEPEWVLTLDEVRLPGEAIPTVMFDHLRLVTLLDRSGEAQHQAVGMIRAVGIQGLRIGLPTGADLWSVSLDGQPVEVRNETSSIYLPWPTGSSADTVRTLQVVFRTPGQGLSSLARLEQVPPRFEAVTGAGEVVHVEILAQSWELLHPEEALLIHSQGEFRPREPLAISSLLSRLPRSLSWPTRTEISQTFWTLGWLIVIVAGPLLVVRLWRRVWHSERLQALPGWWKWGTVGVGSVVILVIAWSLLSRLLPGSSQYLADVGMFSTQSEPASGAATDDWYFKTEPPAGAEGDYDASFGLMMDRPDGDHNWNGLMPGMSGEGATPPFRRNQGGFGGGFGGGGFPGEPPTSEMEQLRDLDRDRVPGLAERQLIDGLIISPEAPGPAWPESAAGQPFDDRGVTSESAAREERAEDLATLQAPSSMPAGDAVSSVPDQSLMFSNGPLAIDQPGLVSAEEYARPRARGALLSLPISMVTPPRTITTVFEYVGAQSDVEGTRLSVSYIDRQMGRTITWICAAVVLCLMWWLRRRSPGLKLVMGLCLPAILIGAALVAPGIWHVALDGLLLGLVGGLGLWLLWGLVGCCGTGCMLWSCDRSSTTPAPGTSQAPQLPPACWGGIVLWGLLAGMQVARGDEPGEGRSITPTRVIVPYEDLSEIGRGEISRVIIPRDDFWKLWHAAHPELGFAPPPEAALVTRADLQASLAPGGPARVLVSAEFEVLTLHEPRGAGPAPPEVLTIPLPLRPVPIREARLGDESANVVVRDGRLVLLLPLPRQEGEQETTVRRHVLSLEFDLPAAGATSSKGDVVFPLAEPSSGSLRFTLPRPAAELDLLVGDGRESYRLLTTDGEQALEVSSALRGETRVSWQIREMRGQLESTVHAETGVAVVLSRQGLSVRHAFQVRVLQGALSELRMTLPSTGRLQQIVGPDVVGWQYDQSGETHELTIYFRSDVSSTTQILVDLFQPVEVDGVSGIDVPFLRLQGVSREAGVVAIFPLDDLTARVQNAVGLRLINVDQFTPVVSPELPGSSPSQAFRLTGEAVRGLTLLPAPRSLRTVADVNYGVRITYRKLLTTTRVRLSPSASPRSSILVELPEDFLLTSVAGPEIADWFEIRAAGGVRRLQIDLATPHSGEQLLVLDGHLPRDVQQPTTRILLPRVLDTDDQTAELAVWVDDVFVPTLTNIGGWQTFDRQQLSTLLRSLDARPAWQVFRAEGAAPEPLELQLDRGVPRLRGVSVTLTAVTEIGVDYGFTFQWDVSQAAADTFIVQLPAWLNGIRFDVPGLRQIRSTPVGTDVLEWRLELIQPVSGRFLVSAVASVPLPANGRVLAPAVDMREAVDRSAFELTNQQHYALVVNLSRSRLLPDPEIRMETVGRNEVPIVLRDELLQQAMAIVRVRDQATAPAWNLVSAAGQQATSDLVLRADLATLVEMDGTWRTRATYLIRNRGRQYLPVRLPPHSRILSVIVRGEASRAFLRTIGGQGVHLIPLPATSAADLSYEVVLTTEGMLASRLPVGVNLFGRDLEIPLPLVLAPEDSREYGLPVGQLLWTVHLPEEVVAEPVMRGGLTNLTRHDRSEFLVQALSIELSNYAGESEELIKLISDEQNSFAQRRQALESLQAMNFRLSTIDAKGGLPSSGLSQEQQALLGMNTLVLQGNSSLLSDAVPEFTLSQQEIGRFFCASNSGLILMDNRDTATFTDGLSAQFSLAEKEMEQLNRFQDPSRQRANLRGSLEEQVLDYDFAEQSAQQSSVQFFSFGRDRELWEGRAQAGMAAPWGLQVPVDGEVLLGESGVRGGLSLPVDLPWRGRELSFSRLGGDGKLTLRVRPRATLEGGLGWLWGLLWGGAALWSLWVILPHVRHPESAWRAAATPMMVLGLMGFLLLGDPLRWIGFGVLTIGLITRVWGERRLAPVSTP